MKKQLILLFILFAIGKQATAQTSNAILFTENGEKFTAILNGLRQNDKPETNVKITGLIAEWYKLKVIFENTAQGEQNFNLSVQLGNETSYSIKKNNKGAYVLRLISTVPLAQAPVSAPAQNVVVYNQNPKQNTGVTHSQTTTSITTTHNENPDNVNINMGIDAGDQGGNISINMSGMDGETIQSETTTITTVTHSTTTTNQQTYDTEPVAPVAPPSYLPGYTGAVGCTPPMTPSEFSAVKGTISSKSFEETKITIAKQIINSHCMFVSQVKEIMQMFSFEESKLDIAKYAYDHTYDTGNYYKLNDAFTFETSTDELNEYVNSRR